MPRIFDNIESSLLPALRHTLSVSERGDFCVGYFNLRGWKSIDDLIANWSGNANEQCRLLVGMQRLPQDELRIGLGSATGDEALDNQSASRLKRKLAEEFRLQLMLGMPTNEDEAGLRRLSEQLKTGKVVVKLFLKHPLHAKLYLLFRPDANNPITGFLGSSNLTLSGLSKQGELNVDVLDHDATIKLARWFDDRWSDRWCVDITAELIEVIEQSWAREVTLDPYLIYVKMAYHLAQEARAGLNEFRIPPEFGKRLYQEAAVKIAAHHLNKRGGVLIGDVVGLGKTLMATALAKIFQDDHFTETLIICPKNLIKMWEDYVSEYRLIAKVLSLTRVISELPELRRYRVVLIDESHNLRNREGRRYRAIQEYLTENESRCILLSATPYNKTYGDLSNQLRLFVPDDRDIGVRPERLLQDIGETEFVKRYQCPVRSLAGFEKSTYADDWRELMRLYMVRRTRTFIQENYAKTDPTTGRKFLTFEDGTRSYFPARIPRTLKFRINDKDAGDQYARLTAFFCSKETPGATILKAFDQAAAWRDMGQCIISGFHSPLEQQCLEILLRGKQPIVMALARGISVLRLPAPQRKAFDDGRLMIISPFSSTKRRASVDLARQRNRFAAALVDEVVFAYISPSGSLFFLSEEITSWGGNFRQLHS